MLNHQDRLFNLLDGMEMTKSEHDWLELRFANMTEKERLLFTGALELERPTQADRVMELANQLPCFDLYYRVWDDEALGRFVLENLERPSPEAVPFLNAEQVGAAYREQDKGIFCQGHYIRKSSLTIPMPETSQLLQPAVGDYAIRVRLASRENMDGVWVGFPDTGDHMDAAHPDELLLGLDELHAETLSECIVLEVDCCLPQLEDIPDQYASAGELVRHAIDFGYAWAERGQGEPHWLDKWQAVLELRPPWYRLGGVWPGTGCPGRRHSQVRPAAGVLRLQSLRRGVYEPARAVRHRPRICRVEWRRDLL